MVTYEIADGAGRPRTRPCSFVNRVAGVVDSFYGVRFTCGDVLLSMRVVASGERRFQRLPDSKSKQVADCLTRWAARGYLSVEKRISS